MRSLRITSRRAVEALFPLLDDAISTVANEEAAALEVAEIEAVIEAAERAWAAAERTELLRVSRVFMDQTRARRAHRRADRLVLRVLPRELGEGAA